MMDAIKFNCFVIIVNIKNFRFVKRLIDISLFYFATRKIQLIDDFQTELTQMVVANRVAESYNLDS